MQSLPELGTSSWARQPFGLLVLVFVGCKTGSMVLCSWAFGFGGRATGGETTPRVTLLHFPKCLSSLHVLEVFCVGVEVGNILCGFDLPRQRRRLFRATLAEIMLPEWDRSKAEMALKEVCQQLWHLNGKMRRQVVCS